MKILTVLLLSLGFAPAPALPMFGSIAFNAISAGANDSTGTATGATDPITVSGSNTILFTCLVSGTANAPLTAVYNTTEGMTSLGSADSGGYRTEAFYRINPTAGTHNVVVSLGTGVNVLSTISGQYTEAQQSGVPEAAATTGNSGAAGDFSLSTTTVASNAWAVGCFGGSSASAVSIFGGSPGNTEGSTHGSFSQIGLLDSGAVGSPGATSIHADYNAGSSFGTGVIFSFAPTGGAAPTFPHAILNAPVRGGGTFARWLWFLHE